MDGIKSKERVQQHGEVFTPDSIVNDMLDAVDESFGKSVDNAWEYIDRTYLEPACGNGNFLLRILDRKLAVVKTLSEDDWELGLIRAVTSIYGVDIQKDNVIESRARMLKLIKEGYVDVLELQGTEIREFSFGAFNLTDNIESILKLILERNIICGNTLTGIEYDESGETTKQMIITEYTWDGNKVTMREQEFSSLIPGTLMYDMTYNKYDKIEYTKIYETLNSIKATNVEDEYIF